MLLQYPYSIFPLGDSAITIDFGNSINEEINKKILALFKAFQNQPLPGIIEAVPAYSSMSVYYDPLILKKNVPANKTIQEYVKDEIENFLQKNVTDTDFSPSKFLRIPVCYEDEFSPDLDKMQKANGLSKEEIIWLHNSKRYRVYMLGFLPGFPYMGLVDQKISMPRKPVPQTVAAGSVAIAGRQTGIYPLASPGGWSVIGRTPLKLFDPEKEKPTLFQAGDTVEFYPIVKDEFLNLLT